MDTYQISILAKQLIGNEARVRGLEGPESTLAGSHAVLRLRQELEQQWNRLIIYAVPIAGLT